MPHLTRKDLGCLKLTAVLGFNLGLSSLDFIKQTATSQELMGKK